MSIKILFNLWNNIALDPFISEIILFDNFKIIIIQKIDIHISDFILNINKTNNYNILFCFF